MGRLEPMFPRTLDGGRRRLYDAITNGPRAQGRQFPLTGSGGELLGPFNAFLLAPEVGGALQELGAVVRYRCSLRPRAREIAILLVAARWDCAYERYAHERVGRSVGLTDTELADLRRGEVPPLDDPYERACAHLARAMTRGDVDDAQWRTWVPVIGEATVFELTTLVGYYSTLALQLRVFRVDSEGE